MTSFWGFDFSLFSSFSVSFHVFSGPIFSFPLLSWIVNTRVPDYFACCFVIFTEKGKVITPTVPRKMQWVIDYHLRPGVSSIQKMVEHDRKFDNDQAILILWLTMTYDYCNY